mmetsp:Transcript_19269/g.48165  ORF Transcript_19269/g.48165 Transcript_19269/m.48165 type:complete len:218 (+) Transcript_19269:680-1333(+)
MRKLFFVESADLSSTMSSSFEERKKEASSPSPRLSTIGELGSYPSTCSTRCHSWMLETSCTYTVLEDKRRPSHALSHLLALGRCVVRGFRRTIARVSFMKRVSFFFRPRVAMPDPMPADAWTPGRRIETCLLLLSRSCTLSRLGEADPTATGGGSEEGAPLGVTASAGWLAVNDQRMSRGSVLHSVSGACTVRRTGCTFESARRAPFMRSRSIRTQQ